MEDLLNYGLTKDIDLALKDDSYIESLWKLRACY